MESRIRLTADPAYVPDPGTTTAAMRLAAFATSLAPGDIPVAVREAAALHVLDTVGCGLAAVAGGVGAQGTELAAHDGGAPEAPVIGLVKRVPAAAAALANGMLCHGLDFDDTHPDAIAHIGTVVGPAALAAAAATTATGSELVTAYVVGSEVIARVGAAAADRYMTRGFHPTSVFGVFGATAAAARLYGLSAAQTAAALGIAGSMAAGLFEYLSEGTETKPIHAGWAAHGGVTAARLAALGAAGPTTILEGRFGILSAYFDHPDLDLRSELEDLGECWETPRVAFKPYPACHFVHSCLDAARELRADSIRSADIASVRVTIPSAGLPLVAQPDEHKRRPRTAYDAKFSVQYSVAAMLVHGSVAVSTYQPNAIADPEVLDVAARVEVTGGTFPTYPEAFPGRVELVLADGRTVSATREHQRGGERNPMTAAEVREKFRANAELALPPADVDELEAAILTLDKARDLSGLETIRSARAKEAT